MTIENGLLVKTKPDVPPPKPAKKKRVVDRPDIRAVEEAGLSLEKFTRIRAAHALYLAGMCDDRLSRMHHKILAFAIHTADNKGRSLFVPKEIAKFFSLRLGSVESAMSQLVKLGYLVRTDGRRDQDQPSMITVRPGKYGSWNAMERSISEAIYFLDITSKYDD